MIKKWFDRWYFCWWVILSVISTASYLTRTALDVAEVRPMATWKAVVFPPILALLYLWTWHCWEATRDRK